jgi:iron(II)-dependent oxidoreductase
VHERFFYDPVSRRYTVSRYLDDLQQRYGGVDSVLVWQSYPNLGIDDRNQYDLFRDLPGGIPGIRGFIADFHSRGVKVLFPVMVWDQGTRDEESGDAQAIASEMKEVGADGVNGDTLEGMPYVFRSAAEALHYPLALEPELGPASDELLNWNTSSWGYWDYSFVPVISRFKWLESRHLVHISNRLAHDHTDDLQHAFLNGVGFESWENVWSIWNGLTPRDAATLRRVASIERFAKKFLVSAEWVPFVPTLHFGVFASKWPAGADGTLWTIINRNHYAVGGRQIKVAHRSGTRYFDLWHGVELTPERLGDQDLLSFDLEKNGYGSILAIDASAPPPTKLMMDMQLSSGQLLSGFSSEWTALPQRIVPIPVTPAPKSLPIGMSRIAAADFVFRVNGIEIEGGDDEGLDVQYPGEASARRYHDLEIHISPFWMDTTPVSNAEYKRFLDATHYRPIDIHNFLRDWKNGEFPANWDDKPVTWVSIEDARAYATWAGKRLPHEWEWQYAAQGMDGRDYPWGNAMVPSNMPIADRGRRLLPPSGSHSHVAGASPFGVLDLVGNVWQWTDEWSDEHTRWAILRGGSHYQPSGSRWYFPQAYKLSQHGKYLLMAPSLDRSGTIGFRCVADDPGISMSPSHPLGTISSSVHGRR